VLCEGEEGKDGALKARLFQEPEVEGAIVCLDPRTGEVLACVGGYDYGRSQFNRAVQAQRQPGSAIKPLIYSAAIEKGHTPATVIYDTPVVYELADPDEKWKPKNFTDQFYGPTTLRDALVFSRNIVTVKILERIGIPYATGYLESFGLRGPITPGLSLALGATGVSALELAAAYSTFPAGGVRRDPVFLLRVEDRDGKPLEVFDPPAGRPVLRPETAYVLTHMMESVIKEGTGRAARGLGRPCAGKTGTTNDNRDAWFVGFTPDLVAAVWVGYDDSRNLAKGETGGKAAAPIWLDFMREAIQGRAVSDFPVPTGIEFAKIDAEKGTLADPSSKNVFTAAFCAGTVPQQEYGVTRAPAAVGMPVDPRDPGSLNALR
jgi:penicillin-binding protein 1A